MRAGFNGGEKLGKNLESEIIKSIRTLADEKIESSTKALREEESRILSEIERSGAVFSHFVGQIVSLYQQHIKTCLRIIYSEWLTHIPNLNKKGTKKISARIKQEIEGHFEDVYKKIDVMYRNSMSRFSPSLRNFVNAGNSLFTAKEEALDVFHSELNIYLTAMRSQTSGIYKFVSNKFVLPVLIGVVVGLIILAIRLLFGF